MNTSTITEADSSGATLVRRREGKYLTFVLGSEEYGLDIVKVREIFGIMDITPVPKTPDYIKGVINLRGKVISVVDLRLKFGMELADYTEETCIIVVEVGDIHMGIVVDTVSEVLDIVEEDIEPPPSFGNQVNTQFILGMGKIKGQVKILLDIENVLSGRDIELAANLSEEAEIN